MPPIMPTSLSKTLPSNTIRCARPASPRNCWRSPAQPWRWVKPNRSARFLNNMNKGKIVQVIGPVVDVEFPTPIPAIYNALTVDYKVLNQPAKLTLEVQQHLGDNWVRTVAMSSTEGLKRGLEVMDTGASISMPVGDAVMGRVFDVTGNPVDERGPVTCEKRYPIHRPAPPLVDPSTAP